MNLSDITPMILTYNERENIGRTLDTLKWASQVLVIDSGSTDETPAICAQHPNVRLVTRAFDTAANQCNFGLHQITTEWVLSLDADYQIPPEFADELRDLSPRPDVNGYAASFVYCVFGRRLRGTLYPPRKVLYRRSRAEYRDDGHTQRVYIQGQTEQLTAPLLHDDRKPLSRWFSSQTRYARQETEKLLSQDRASLRLTDRIRTWRFVAPVLNLIFVLFVRGVILDGPPGWYYAVQRLVAELMISLFLLDHDIRKLLNRETLDISK